MSDTPNLGFLVAFLAGILSFLSPCVLPLVPSYVGFLTGMSLPELTSRKRIALLHALCFVAGFSLIFVLLGASATALGRALKYNQVWLTRVGGLLIFVFGLYCLGLFKVGALQMERRVHLQDKPVGFLGSVLVGMAFGAGWTPCIGPILGAILSLATVEADVGRGMLLLGAYSAGLAVPFLLAAVAVEQFFDWFQRFRKYLPWVMRTSGVLLVIVGILMMTGEFTRLAGWLQSLTPDFLKSRI
ncbi:MAG TPA: cytochrome c biogenesis protein CcdA, partial [Gemmatimonadales bacterium]|nr:cytochrome c biogenesis protein CcdA [Gemmatimonadales bacterium]